uniref:Uncharacterized protein n=1 Tax=Arundo donax TaxID=35708 RepID=A0A0A9GAJ8_ARUDO
MMPKWTTIRAEPSTIRCNLLVRSYRARKRERGRRSYLLGEGAG